MRSPALWTVNNYYWPGTQTSFVLHWKPQMQAVIIATQGKTHKNPSQAMQNNSPKRNTGMDTELLPSPLAAFTNQEENPALYTQQSRGLAREKDSKKTLVND